MPNVLKDLRKLKRLRKQVADGRDDIATGLSMLVIAAAVACLVARAVWSYVQLGLRIGVKLGMLYAAFGIFVVIVAGLGSVLTALGYQKLHGLRQKERKI